LRSPNQVLPHQYTADDKADDDQYDAYLNERETSAQRGFARGFSGGGATSCMPVFQIDWRLRPALYRPNR
jgi:hypothetical protein